MCRLYTKVKGDYDDLHCVQYRVHKLNMSGKLKLNAFLITVDTSSTCGKANCINPQTLDPICLYPAYLAYAQSFPGIDIICSIYLVYQMQVMSLRSVLLDMRFKLIRTFQNFLFKTRKSLFLFLLTQTRCS